MTNLRGPAIVERHPDLRGPAIVIRGSVISGFSFYGTFPTVEDAVEWLQGTLPGKLNVNMDTVALLEPVEQGNG